MATGLRRSRGVPRLPPGGFLSNGVPTHSTKSPGREPGDSGNEHRPGCHFDAFFASQSINMATGALVRKSRRPGPVHERARRRRTCGTPRCHRRLLRLMRPTAISRHLPTLKAKLMARVGEEFPLECPWVRRRHPAHRVPPKPGPIRKVLTYLGEPLEAPPVSPARGPPTDWGELVQVHFRPGNLSGKIGRAHV